MTLEERLEALEEMYETLRDQHLALMSLTLALLPAKKLGKEGVGALFMLAHQNAGAILSAGDTDESVQRAVTQAVDDLHQIVLQQFDAASGD